MNHHQAQAIMHCNADSLAGRSSFPQTVQKLLALEVERYYVDYTSQQTIYYTRDSNSLCVPFPHEPTPIAGEFDVKSVKSAVISSQRNEHTYEDFVRKTRAAGCVGYLACLTGKRVIYLGRQGDSHTEHFPGVLEKK